ncbi:hypothetical protein [Streptomyces sp. NPDC002133]
MARPADKFTNTGGTHLAEDAERETASGGGQAEPEFESARVR